MFATVAKHKSQELSSDCSVGDIDHIAQTAKSREGIGEVALGLLQIPEPARKDSAVDEH